MKIGIVTEYYYPTVGGIQEHVYHFTIELLKKGHQATIITSNVSSELDAKEDIKHGLRVIRLGKSVPIYSNGSIARLTIASSLGKKLAKIFEEEKFDIIHIHSPLTPTLPLLSLVTSNTVTIGTFHTNFKGNIFMSLFKKECQKLIERLDGVIAVSKITTESFGRYFDFSFKIIPNGVDIEQFNPNIPNRLEYNDGMINILFVGRLEPRNGFDRMIKAFTEARKRNNKLRLIVIGDGPLRSIYEDMIVYDLRKDVHFVGQINGARPSYYASAHMLCVPVTISSLAVTLLEGMSAGLPIISSDIDGVRDVITNGKEGFIVDTSNINIFSETILKLAEDKSLREKLGKCGVATAQKYNWSYVTDMILDYYNEVIEKRKRKES